jgi:hypothetical protein
MPWTCPACGSSIQHTQDLPLSGITYRCHVCRLELVVDAAIGKMTVAPLPGDKRVQSPNKKSTKPAIEMPSRTTLTTQPPNPPPSLRCSECHRRLTYVHSYLSGTQRQQDQWDVFCCPRKCGDFEYRHRTRKLRRLPEEEANTFRIRTS